MQHLQEDTVSKENRKTADLFRMDTQAKNKPRKQTALF